MSSSRLMLIAYLWRLSSGLVIQSIGVASTLLLVRLLTPRDFGVAAVVIIITGLLSALVQSGGGAYIQIVKKPDKGQINTAWTLILLTRVGIAAFIFFLAEPLSRLFDMQELRNVLHVVWLLPIMQGLSNPGTLLLQRQLQYRPEAKLGVITKIISTATTVFLAFAGFSYWSLIIGDLIKQALLSAGSYVIHPYVPRLSLSNLKAQWAFTKWVTLTSITGYMRSKTENLFMSRTFSPEILGVYAIAQRFSFMPANELIFPAAAPLLNRLRQDKARASHLSTRYLSVCFVVVIPAAAGLALLADDFVALVLGSQWTAAVPMMQTLPFIMLPMATFSVCRTLMLLHQRIKFQVLLDVGLITAIAIPFILQLFSSVENFLVFRLWLAAGYQLALMAIMTRLFEVPTLAWLSIMLIPASATLPMVYVLEFETIQIRGELVTTVIAETLLGLGMYITTLMLILCVLQRYNSHANYLYMNMQNAAKQLSLSARRLLKVK